MKITKVLLFLLIPLLSFSQRRVQRSITDFGAIGDGVTNNASVFTLLNSIGSGSDTFTIYVPKGTYRTGTATINSNVNLEFEAGSRIVLNTASTLTINGKVINCKDVFYTNSTGARVVLRVDKYLVDYFWFRFGENVTRGANYQNRRTWEMLNNSLNDANVTTLETPCGKTLEIDFDIGVQGVWLASDNTLTIYCPCPENRFKIHLLQDTLGTIQYAYQIRKDKNLSIENLEFYTNNFNWRNTTYNVTANNDTISVSTPIFQDSVFDEGRIIYLKNGSFASLDTVLHIDTVYSPTLAHLKYRAPATRTGDAYFSTQAGSRTLFLMLGSNVDSVSIKWSSWGSFVTCTTTGCFDQNDVGAVMEIRKPGSVNDVFLAEINKVKGDTAFLVAPINNNNGNPYSWGFDNTQTVYRATRSNFTARNCKFWGNISEIADSGQNLYNGTIAVYNCNIETFKGGFQMRGGIYAKFIMQGCNVTCGINRFGHGSFELTGTDMNVLHSNGNSSILVTDSKFFNSRAFGMSQNKAGRADAVPWFEPKVEIRNVTFDGEGFYKGLELVSKGSIFIDGVISNTAIVADAHRHLSVTNTKITMLSPNGTINALDLSSRDSVNGMYISNISIKIENGSHAINVTNGFANRKDFLDNISIYIKTDTTKYVWESPRSTYILRFNTASDINITNLYVKTFKPYDRYRAVLYSQKSQNILFDKCEFRLADTQMDLGWIHHTTSSPATKWLFRDCISTSNAIDLITGSLGTFDVGAETTVIPTQTGSAGTTLNVTNL